MTVVGIEKCVMDAEEMLVEYGFAILPAFFKPEELTALSEELAQVLQSLREELSGETLEDLVVLQYGCIVEPTKTVVSEPARRKASTIEEYVRLRAGNSKQINSKLSNRVSEFIFNHSKLRGLLSKIFGDVTYFYNEQYIVKPPEKNIAKSEINLTERTSFPWHRDSDNAQTCEAFVSFWIALTDMSKENGSLELRPYGWREGDPMVNVEGPRGSLVLLAHDVEHRSSPNLSNQFRNAYMVQFSQIPIECHGELIGYSVAIDLL